MERLMKIDRRIIYLLGAAIVFLTMLYPLGLPVAISDLARQTYNEVENLPDDAVVILSPMYDSGAMGELNPMFVALFRHCAERGYKIIIVNTQWVQGPQIVHKFATEIAEEYGYVYGEDWINLGSKPGAAIFLQTAVKDFWEACIEDFNGQPVESYPIMQLVPKVTAEYVDACLVLNCGTPGAPEWLAYVCQPEGIKLVIGEIQMSVPESMPYVQSGQYAGMIAGSRGCAEYEQLIGHPGQALKAQDTMSAIALMVTLFIILGNIGYLATRKK
ncbi:MAG TPA: hypothetical protein DHW14_09875 [Clostridiales bacterium]|nr:hypothetical protein [Clostridiales bacterium]